MKGWNEEGALTGRRLASIALDPRAAVRAPDPLAFLVVLCGSAEIDGRRLGAGEFAFAPGADVVAGPDGCRLGAVHWTGSAPTDSVRIESTDSRAFEKYQSFQAQTFVRAGDVDVLAPWELYCVRMVGRVEERVQLHVHHVVTNVLFVPGDVGVERGYLVTERDGRVTAMPLVGGDLAMVRPGLNHHVVPFDGDPVDMIVLNDATSAYEDVERADFHLTDSVPWGEVEVVARPGPDPRLTTVGPGRASAG